MVQIKRRRREAKTNYKRRIKLLKSGLSRLIVRKSNKNILIQIAIYNKEGDNIVLNINSKKLKEFGWEGHTNIPTAYLTGLLFSKELKIKNKDLSSDKLILDIGLYRPTKNSVIFAAVRGVIDGGINVLNNISFDENRLQAKSISEYANKISNENPEKYQKQFSSYISKNIDVKQLDKIFEQVKQKLSG